MNYYIESSIAKMWIEDEIVLIVFKPNSILSLEAVKQIIKNRLEISEFRDYKLYVDIRSLLSIDLQARKFLSSNEGTKAAIAAAIHINNPISKFLGNLFIVVDKPDKPIKLFTTKSKAINWLKKLDN